MIARVHIAAIGVRAPGLAGWSGARAALTGTAPFAPFAPDAVSAPASTLLAPAERRRLNPNAAWALAVATEALDAAPPFERNTLASVFASADGDGDVLAQTLAALAAPPVAVSPTLFHNSVFNAPACYTSSAHRLTGPSTSICAGEYTFAVALIDAVDQVLLDGCTVLFVAVDLAYPQSLASMHASVPSFACALLLCPSDSALSCVHGSLAIASAAAFDAPPPIALPPWTGHWSRATAAAALPLLAVIAGGAPAALPLVQPAAAPLAVDYRPC
ncbi:MAG: beta-ketoacyl synthase chain length factor [Casimicrobiaceae bacterium]